MLISKKIHKLGVFGQTTWDGPNSIGKGLKHCPRHNNHRESAR
jgi:hypothetical protein